VSKTIVCRCEDVTLDELMHALSLGYSSIEELKRFTGFGTGPCQGKECQAQVGRLVEAAGLVPRAFTARPPFSPTPLGVLAGADALIHGGTKK
jgi:bacterioferritin-associated ferredoxin